MLSRGYTFSPPRACSLSFSKFLDLVSARIPRDSPDSLCRPCPPSRSTQTDTFPPHLAHTLGQQSSLVSARTPRHSSVFSVPTILAPGLTQVVALQRQLNASADETLRYTRAAEDRRKEVGALSSSLQEEAARAEEAARRGEELRSSINAG